MSSCTHTANRGAISGLFSQTCMKISLWRQGVGIQNPIYQHPIYWKPHQTQEKAIYSTDLLSEEN